MSIKTAEHLRELAEFLRGHGHLVAASELEALIDHEVANTKIAAAVGLAS